MYYISFCFEIRAHLGHLFVQAPKRTKCNRLSCSKYEPNTKLNHGSVFRTDWMIRLKRGQNPFFGPTFGPQTPKYPKSIPREPLVVESWLTAYMTARFDLLMGVLRYVYLSDNRKYPKNTIYFFRALYDEISKFSIPQELYIKLNWITFQNDWETHPLVFNTMYKSGAPKKID